MNNEELFDPSKPNSPLLDDPEPYSPSNDEPPIPIYKATPANMETEIPVPLNNIGTEDLVLSEDTDSINNISFEENDDPESLVGVGWRLPAEIGTSTEDLPIESVKKVEMTSAQTQTVVQSSSSNMEAEPAQTLCTKKVNTCTVAVATDSTTTRSTAMETVVIGTKNTGTLTDNILTKDEISMTEPLPRSFGYLDFDIMLGIIKTKGPTTYKTGEMFDFLRPYFPDHSQSELLRFIQFFILTAQFTVNRGLRDLNEISETRPCTPEDGVWFSNRVVNAIDNSVAFIIDDISGAHK